MNQELFSKIAYWIFNELMSNNKSVTYPVVVYLLSRKVNVESFRGGFLNKKGKSNRVKINSSLFSLFLFIHNEKELLIWNESAVPSYSVL